MSASDREFDVVVLGGINTDFVVRGRELPGPGASLDRLAFLRGPGGKGGNAAVAATRLGARTAIIGRVGDDDRGHMLVAGRTDQHIDVACVSIDEQTATGAAVIQVDAGCGSVGGVSGVSSRSGFLSRSSSINSPFRGGTLWS